MTPTAQPAPPTTAAQAARLLNAYARRYHAGAFATPIASELSKIMHGDGGDRWWYWWDGVAGVARTLTRPAARRDFTGRRVVMPAGATILDHIAPAPGAPIPNLAPFDWIWAYVEDTALTAALHSQGREVTAVRISAASEIIACWGRAGTGRPYPAHDQATITRLPLTVTDTQRRAALAEVNALTGWHDDFPYYSDGSWGALSLRGFNPGDPRWGIKPAEMSKNWWAKHPEAKQYTHCEWTTLAPHCPTLVELTCAVVAGWGGTLERVRLLRMAARGGGGGRLARHTDITDRAAGTADGQIIRLHLPLVTHPAVTMTGWNLHGEQHTVHLPPWTLWYLDARKPHAVHNGADIDRVHLVIDVTATPAARAAIAAGTDRAAPRTLNLTEAP